MIPVTRRFTGKDGVEYELRLVADGAVRRRNEFGEWVECGGPRFVIVPVAGCDEPIIVEIK